MYKFTGFTESANNALNYAVEAAENMGHTYIGSEHILLGLLSDSKMVSATMLGGKRITLKKTEEQLKSAVGVGMPTNLTPDDITPRCRKIIENAIAMGTAHPMGEAGTEQLLNALLKENGCSAGKLLVAMGVQPHEFMSGSSGMGDSGDSYTSKSNRKNY